MTVFVTDIVSTYIFYINQFIQHIPCGPVSLASPITHQRAYIMATKVKQLSNRKIIAPAEDAIRAVYITVHQLHLKRAVTFAPDECVLAKATCEAFPNVIKAWFYQSAVYIAFGDPKTGKPTKTLRYIPSPEAVKNIGTFDLSRKFLPGVYRLDPPSGSNTLKAIRARTKKGRHHPTGKGTSRTPSYESQARLETSDKTGSKTGRKSGRIPELPISAKKASRLEYAYKY